MFNLRMDATEQSVGPNKQIRIKTPKKNGRGTFNISNRSENFDKYAGLLNPPLPRAISEFNNQYYRQSQQPPLLPLPNVSATNHQHHHPQLSRSLKKTRDMSLTPKKSRPTKREEAAKKRSATLPDFLIVASDNRWGPDPKDLPKHLLPVVLTSKVFSGSVLSPPPSSLPLPKFFLRSKLSCNAEAAAGVDAGATNNLRRLLRLR